VSAHARERRAAGRPASTCRYWLKVAGTAARPFVQDRWRVRYGAWRAEHGNGSLFPRRPAIRRGDRLVVYAAGSAAAFGEGRLFAVEEVVSDEPEPSGHERWPWRLRTRELASVPLLSHAATLSEIGVTPRSLGRHSHIRLADEQGRRAEELIRRYATACRA
jgi:hypothetical protein